MYRLYRLYPLYPLYLLYRLYPFKTHRFHKAYLRLLQNEDEVDRIRRRGDRNYFRDVYEIRKSFARITPDLQMIDILEDEEKAAAEKADVDERAKSASADKSDKKRSPLFSDNDEREWVDWDETSSIEEAVYGNKRKPKADATDPKTPQVDRHRTPVGPQGQGAVPPTPAPKTDKEKIEYFDKYLASKNAGGVTQSSTTSRIFSTGKEIYLTSPEAGQTWPDIDVHAILLKFKENIQLMGKTEDLNYRLAHMDEGWVDYLNNSLFELSIASPPVYWQNLSYREFFHECDKAFGSKRLGTSSKHYASNTLFTQKYFEWLKEEFSEGNQLWSGNYDYDRDRVAKTLSSYNLLATQYPPSEQEKTKEAESLRLLDMRKAIHKAAVNAYSTGDASKQGSLNFMLQVDATVKPGVDLTKVETLRCRTPNSLIESVHSTASYVTSTSSKFAVSKDVTVQEYLRTAMVVMLQIQPFLLYAIAFGLRLPKAPAKKETGNKTGTGKGNKPTKAGDRDRGSQSDSGQNKNSRSDKSQKDSKKETGKDVPRSGSERKKRTRSEIGREVKRSDQDEPSSKKKKKDFCYRCGHAHLSKDCTLKDHPDANHERNVSWAESKYGKLWRDKGKYRLPAKSSISDENWGGEEAEPKDSKSKDSKSSSQPKGSKKPKKNERSSSQDSRESKSSKGTKAKKASKSSDDEREEDSDCKSNSSFASLNTLSNPPLQYFLITCSLYSTPSRVLDRNVAVMLDTGAIDRSYVSIEVGKELKKAGSLVAPCDVDKICSCSRDNCFACLGKVPLHLKFFNELTNSFEMISLVATIIESDFDVIVGRPDIGRNDLINKCYKQMFSDVLSTSEPDVDRSSEEATAGRVGRLMTASTRTDAYHSKAFRRPAEVLAMSGYQGCVPTTVQATSRQANKDIPETSGNPRSCSDKVLTYVTGLQPPRVRPGEVEAVSANIVNDERHVRHRSELLSGSHDQFEDCDLEDEAEDWDPINGNDSKKTYLICGPDELQAKLKLLLEEYKDIFCDKLSKIPAKVEPMSLTVDAAKWDSKRNRLPPRPMSTAKQKEIKKQVEQMLGQQLIRPSKALSWSQVLLTPKPNGEWRFCVDFRGLNDASKAEGWPLPNITQMLRRIGDAKPKFFAIMDLTKGFYQAPLAEESKKFTAFTCFCGLYEWNRVPMGLKGAPSFYQMVLATIVFVGLINYIMELYIDDLIIHAQTIDELISRLRTVFETLRKFNMTVNPAKCRFGLSEIEYVGHIIDPTGLSFSKDKKEKVRMFPKPMNCKHVKQFLGLVNYFRDHVQNISVLMKPMQQMIIKYEKARRVQWTPEAEEAFEKIKDAIVDSAKLYFVDDNIDKNPVFLEVDACDYGIGAYLYQICDGQQHPIQFMSKALNATQLKWATGEKEAYAIFYGIKKLRPLLRDIYFTLRTDHKNLTYINDSASAKVNRWKLELMEYNFDCEHIAGVKNVVADSLSRLMTLSSSAKPRAYDEFEVAPAHVLAVLALPEGGKLSPFKTSRRIFKLLTKCHNKFQGHSGVERTLERAVKLAAAEREKIPNLRAHVQDFIRKCPCCQKMSQLKAPILSRRFTTSTYTPNERIYIDSIGPLVADEKNNTYVVNIIDGFSRWVELYAVPDTTAETAAKVALIDWVGRFGVPLQIMTDGGTQFANELWTELSILLGSEKLESFPYSHEENGLIERSNKEAMRHLRAIIFDDKLQYSNWSTYLPLVQRILNGSPIGATGITPAQLLYGDAVSINERIFPKTPTYVESRPLSAVMSDMLKMQHHLVGLHEKLLRKHDAKHLAIPFDTTRRVDQYPIGSYVLVDYDPSSVTGRRPAHKLMPFKRGPYRVVNSIGSRYTLLDLITNKHEDVLLHRLHPFRYDQEFLDPKDIAMRDREEYEVQKVLDHEGDPKLKGQMKFLVQWKGYDKNHNSWEPWKSLRLVDKLHVYLKNHNMEKLIPRECLKEQTPEPSRHAKKRVRIDEMMNEFITLENDNSSVERRRSPRLRKTT